MENVKYKPFTLFAIILGMLIIFGASVSADDSYSYSIIHISDTQKLSQDYPSTLNFTFSYVESIKSTFNISAIIITGDLVDNGDDVSQWINYTNAKSFTTIPIYEVLGNHDLEAVDNNTLYYEFVGDKNNWTAVINDFVFIGIGENYQPLTDSDILYYTSIIEAAPQKFTLIATHNYYNEYFTVSPLGESIRDNLVLKPTFVLSGHAHNSWIRSTLVNNISYIVDLTNYQDYVDFSAGKLYTVYTTGGDVVRVTVRDVYISPFQYLGAEITVYDGMVVNKYPVGASITSTILANVFDTAASIKDYVEERYILDSIEDYLEERYYPDSIED